MDEKTSKAIALKLIKAVSADDVDQVMHEYRKWFGEESNWHPYGGQENNWGTANNQQGDPAGALLEIIINGMDAVLMKKNHEFESEHQSQNGSEYEQPQNMYEAVGRFFDVPEGRISNLDTKQELGRLADEVVQVGIKRVKRSDRFPTYTIIDFGEGQEPDDFPQTFLSIGGGNKNRIPFVQGQYNQGSLGCIPHCTQGRPLLGGYKLILSKKSDTWGWTLIKIKPAEQDEKNPVVVYFCAPNGIPRFRQNALSAFNSPKIEKAKREKIKIGEVERGTIIKLYQYSIGERGHVQRHGLGNVLARNLIISPLPFRIYDFDEIPLNTPDQNVYRRNGIWIAIFSGLKNMLTGHAYQESEEEDNGIKEDHANYINEAIFLGGEENEEIGKIRIEAYVRSKMPEYITKTGSKKVVFYTKNGQTHAHETAGFLNRAGLGELGQHIVVNVICDDLDKNLNLFKADRERMNLGEDYEKIKKIVWDRLSASKRLEEIQKKLMPQRTQAAEKDLEFQRKFWGELLSDLFPSGTDISGGAMPIDLSSYEGNKFPTYIELYKKSDAKKKIPINAKRRIIFKCDAENDYLTRDATPGRIYFNNESGSGSGKRKINYDYGELRDGKITLTLSGGHTTQIGDVEKCEFGFEDDSRAQPLTAPFEIEFTKEEPPPSSSPSDAATRRVAVSRAAMPRIEWVEKNEWEDRGFNEETGAHVSEVGDDAAGTKEIIIRVNKDNKYLHTIREKKKDQPHIETIFKFGLAALTLAVYEKMKDDVAIDDEAYKKASSALARSIVQVVQHTSQIKK